MKLNCFKFVLGAGIVLVQSGCAQLLYTHTPAPVYTSRAAPATMTPPRPQPPHASRPHTPPQPAPLHPTPGVMVYKLNPLEAQPFVQQEALTVEPLPAPAVDASAPPAAPSSTPGVTTDPAGTTPAAPPPPQPAELPVAGSPPVLALLTEAQNNRQSGKTEAAAAALERALRIEPRNAGLFYRLAALRLQQQQPQLAEDLAKKALLLAGADNRLKRHCWLLIEQARRQRGDLAGAEEAQRNAQAL